MKLASTMPSRDRGGQNVKEVDNNQVTEPLKEEILKGDVCTIDEMRAWLKSLGYSDTINDAANSLNDVSL